MASDDTSVSKNKEADVFAQLVESNYRTVYGVAFSTVGDWSAAEDIAQETFLVAWRNRSEVRKPEAFGAWLRKIARNLGRNWIRSLIYRRKLRNRYGQTAQSERSAKAQGEVSRGEQRGEVWGALESLSPKLREVIVLYYLEGRSVDEVGGALGCSASAVKKRLERARPQLRAYFEERWQAELERERERLCPEDAKKRFLGGIALGPVGAVLGTRAAQGGWRLWGHGLVHGDTTAVLGSTANAGAVLAGAKVAGICLGVLVIAAASVTFGGGWSDSPTLSGEPSTTAITPALIQHVAVEHVEPASPGSLKKASPEAAVITIGALLGEQGGVVPVKETQVSGWVVDGDGNAISGACVTAHAMGRPTHGGSTFSMSEPPQGRAAFAPPVETTKVKLCTVTADQGGAFSIDGIQTGDQVMLAASAEGCFPEQCPVAVPRGKPAEGVTLVLRPGVFLEGQVLSAEGIPVTDAEVRAIDFVWTGESNSGAVSSGRGVGSTTCATNDHGRFSLLLRRNGTVSIQVESETGGRATFGEITVEQGAFAALKIPVPAQVYGTVRWADGAPAEGCQVALRAERHFESVTTAGNRSFGGGGGIVSHLAAYEGWVDKSGKYTLGDVDSTQEYIVDVRGPSGVLLAQGMPLDALSPGGHVLWDHAIEAVATLRGIVRDPVSGVPVGGVEVVHRKQGRGQPTVAVTGADGSYELRLASGAGECEVTPRYARSGFAYGPGPEDAFTQALHLTKGETRSLDLKLPQPWTRVFRVIDEEGKAVAGCSVEVREYWNNAAHRWQFGEVADEEGRVRVSGLAPEPDNGCVFSFGGKAGYSMCVQGTLGSRISPSEEIVILYSSAGLSGQLVDESGEPIVNTGFEMAVFWDQGAERRFAGTTGASGEFLLRNELPATRVGITIAAKAGKEHLVCSVDPIDCTSGHILDMRTIVLVEDGDQSAGNVQ